MINKADKDNHQRASLSKKQLENALHILRPLDNNWIVPVLLVSALEKTGIKELWNVVNDYVKMQKKSGYFYAKRKKQAKDWMWSVVMEGLKDMLFLDEDISKISKEMEKAVENSITTPSLAAEKILTAFKKC